MTLTNSPCTDEMPLTGALQQGALTLSASCSNCVLTFASMDLQDYIIAGQYEIYCGGIFYDQGVFSLDYSGPWQNAIDLSNGWWYDWFGYFNTNSAPWIYHLTLGWLYPVGTSADSIWFWDPQWDEGKGGWWWTGSSVFPWIFSVADDGWYWYDAAASTPDARWFCNSNGCALH